jgi:hypothetical protein
MRDSIQKRKIWRNREMLSDSITDHDCIVFRRMVLGPRGRMNIAELDEPIPFDTGSNSEKREVGVKSLDDE